MDTTLIILYRWKIEFRDISVTQPEAEELRYQEVAFLITYAAAGNLRAFSFGKD